jgi:hypothetical protein
VGLGRLDWMCQVTVFPRWLAIVIVLSAQAMVPRCLVNQSIPRITSIPWELSTTRLVGNTTPLRLIGMLITPKWHGMWPPGDLVRRGFFKGHHGYIMGFHKVGGDKGVGGSKIKKYNS